MLLKYPANSGEYFFFGGQFDMIDKVAKIGEGIDPYATLDSASHSLNRGHLNEWLPTLQ